MSGSKISRQGAHHTVAACKNGAKPGIVSLFCQKVKPTRFVWATKKGYTPTAACYSQMAGAVGIEPTTFGFGDRR
ncbi:MAG: hypothetical protein Q4G39_09920, partial [Brachymonas sp.]|nr:hypothetical protein [Brachymonas sp.]